MNEAERLHNARVIAGTTAGFERFHHFRTPFVDPLRSLLPIAVEVEGVPPETGGAIRDLLRARGFFLDEREVAQGRLRLAGPLDRFQLLEAEPPGADLPPGFAPLAAAIVRAVAGRFEERFELLDRGRPWSLPRRPLVMGVLNVTPDSFSDGGRYADPDAAIERAFEMVEEGADVIDVGAESTRPGAAPVPPEEEVRRLHPVLRVLLPQLKVPVSIDTRSAVVAERFLDQGAAIVNDVSGLEADPRLADVAARRRAILVINHIRGTPQTMQDAPRYDDVTAEIGRSLRERLERAIRAGVPESQVILDPGIGFGKRLEDNLDVLARIEELRSLGRPLLIGCSRKGFLGRLTGRDPAERDAATAATTALAALRGVKMVRVHDVRATVDVLRTLDAIDERHRLA